jgi:hypothetical protein
MSTSALTAQLGKAKIEEINEPAAEPAQPQLTHKDLLGRPNIVVFRRALISVELPINAAMEEYDAEADATKWEPYYAIPLTIEPDGALNDKAGNISLAKLRVWSSFAFVRQKDLPTHFPSLVKLTNWRKLFTNMFEIPGVKLEKRTKDAAYPIFQMTGGDDPEVVEAAAALCLKDRLISVAGPIGF